MKIRIHKNEDGTLTVLAKKTRPRESHTILTRGIRAENLAIELGKVIRVVRNEPAEEG